MAVLRNPRHEEFAQLVAINWPRYKAYIQVYGPQKSSITAHANASRLWGHLKSSDKIRSRVAELQQERRKSINLTADQLLDDLLLNIDMATQAGQHSAAITGIH